MRANRASSTSPEMALRRALRSIGATGYRVNYRELPGRPDIVYVRRKLAIFVNGCFWHRCPIHGRDLPRANRSYYLNRTCYNGLCRFNSHGEFNTPFGRYKSINYATDFLDYCAVMKSWVFQSGDFEAIQVRSRDFVYADPPYDVEFTHYSKEGFDWGDQVRLANWLGRLECPVVASNQATPRIVTLYRELGFELTLLPAPRMINCTGDRTPATEMLAVRGFRG